MAVAHYTFGHWPVAFFDGWHWSGQGGYLLYRGSGDGAANVDFDTPVGGANAGQETVYHRTAGLAAETDYTYGLRAVSDAGELEEGEVCVARVRVDGDGALAGLPPNGVHEASVEVLADGYLSVAAYYSTRGQRGTAPLGPSAAPDAQGRDPDDRDRWPRW